ncbi:MAG: hypothetical protein ACKVRO_04785 [Micropepsaceae bacterium]
MFFVLKNVVRLVVSLICLSPIIVPLLAIERKPLVSETDQQTFDGIASAKEILQRFDPRGMDPASTTKVSVRDSEISGAIGAALSRVGNAHARVQAAPDAVLIQGTATLPIPETFLGRYLNVQARIAPSETEFDLKSLSVGSISVPGWIIKPTAIYLLDWFVGEGKGEPIYGSIRSVAVANDVITVGVQPPEGVVADVKAAAGKVLNIDNAEAIRSYYLTLVGTSASQASTPVSLAAYLGPLFAVAQERSQNSDPVEENRALILALAMYFGDERFQALLSHVNTENAEQGLFDVASVRVQRRHDWVRHFATTAGLQVAGGSGLSNLVGEAKEVADSDGPSGFSFTDIAADRTGVRFAEAATSSEASARAMQSAFAGGISEGDFFPKVSDLPEGLSDEAFKQRYGDVGSPAYAAVLKKIDTRIGSIALYQ